MTSTSFAECPKNISRFRAHWEPLKPKFFEISAKYDSFNIRLRYLHGCILQIGAIECTHTVAGRIMKEECRGVWY